MRSGGLFTLRHGEMYITVLKLFHMQHYSRTANTSKAFVV
jgi:hypothetical protein